MISCSSPRSSPPSLACCTLQNTAPPLHAALTRASTCSNTISLSTPNAGWRVCASRHQRQIPSGWRVCAPLPHWLRSLSLHRVTPVAWHTPHLRWPVVRIPGRVILDPGPLGAHPLGGIPFLLRPEHPLLPHRGCIRRGGHGLLLGHDPGPQAVEERLL